MKISIYTMVRNGLYLDYHVVQMLKHHLPLADEIIVNEGFSSDGTYEAIRELDPKIKVFRETWNPGEGPTLYAECKERARLRCTGDWCILMDCDEFIPEWEFDNIRSHLGECEKPIIQMKYVHFYGNYKVYNKNPERSRWVVFKRSIHKNLADIEVWGDGSNVRLKHARLEAVCSVRRFECHHFGFVRNPARLRQKWRIQHGLLGRKRARWDRTPGFLFDLRPHKWRDNDFLGDLAIYTGPVVRAVREEPEEFVRDKFDLYDFLVRYEREQDGTQ